ncbi:MAG: hypothetical protein A2W01_11245 [Candidatus Solincola sediminis]|nr:MAG: hypothetical protein A2W01_11245 [Candidatus Solincola sediminis]
MAESPQLKKETETVVVEPTEKKPTTDAPANEHAKFIAELEKFGVKSPEQLEGKLKASQETGRLAELLGASRKETAELKNYIQSEFGKLNRRPARKENDYEEPSDHQAGGIDLGDLVENKISKVLDARERRMYEQQQRVLASWQRIQGDKDYHLVKNKWEETLKDPNFAIRLQSGEIDPVVEYQEILREHYRSVVMKAADTIKTLTRGPDIEKPHLETGPSGNLTKSETKGLTKDQQKIKALQEKVDKGGHLTEEEQLAALAATLLKG